MPHEFAPTTRPTRSGPQTKTSHGLKFKAVFPTGGVSYWRNIPGTKSPIARRSPAVRRKSPTIRRSPVLRRRSPSQSPVRRTVHPTISRTNTKFSPCAPGYVHYNTQFGTTSCRKAPSTSAAKAHPTISRTNTKFSPCAPGYVHYNTQFGTTSCRKAPRSRS